MKAKAGDWYVVQGWDSEQPERRGMVIHAHGVNGAPPYLVRWLDNGEVETVFPGPEAVIVTAAEQAAADRSPEENRPTKIVILTADPDRKVVIVPGCHLDSLRQDGNAYFFEDGNELVGMIVEGGTVEFDRDERAYIVRLTDGQQ